MATAKKTRQTFSTAEHESEIGEHPPEYDLPSTLVTLTDEEKYLAAILLDKAGIDLVELTWVDEQSETGCYRLFPFQWSWWRCDDPEQIDQGARCLQGGQLVLTARGWQPIEEVLVGDLVLTHRNRWRRVTNRWDRGVAEVVAVAGQGPAAPLVMTPSHKLWARHAVRASKPRDGHKGKKLLEPGWARADELRMNDGSQVMATNWASPAEVASLPLPPQLEPSYRSGPQNLIADLWTPAWMWLYGLFLAEGSTYVDDRYARSTWSVHESEAAEVGAALAAVGLNFHEDRHADGAVVTLVANSRPLALWLREHAGHLAHNKEVAPWAHGLPVELRRAIYEGMVFGDGGHRGRRDSYTSSSRKLMLGFRLLAQSLGRGVSTWAGRKEGATSTLRGREITRRASWSGESQPIEGQSRGRVKVEDGHAWAPVTSVSPAGVAQVWDLEVEEDHSFVCEGVVVHNSLGKSESIIAQGCAFPFNFPTQEFLIVTPEGSHADALTERLEPRIWSTRLIREMLASGGGRRGITHHPFQATFANGARLMVRLPQRSGIGVKGTHPVVLHLDEAQDLSEKTWEETPEIVRTDVEGHMTRAHGVSRGVQDDTFYAKTQPDSGWTVHRLTKMHRPDLKPYRFYDDEGLEMPFTTNDTRVAKRYAAKTGARMEENWRDHQARQYRGRSTSGFKRNVYGLHGNAMNRIFYLDRLMKCVDTMEGSAYNTEEYRSYILDADNVAVEAESRSGRRHDVEVFDDEQAAAIVRLVQLSPQHLADYKTFWIGMDVGIIGDPSEILVFAEYAPKDKERAANASVGMAVPMPGVTRFKLLARVKLTNVAPDLQAHLVMHLIDHYKPKAASIDRTGNGLAILRSLQRMAGTARMYVHEEGERALDPEGQRRAQNALTHIKGYNFGEKVVIDIDEKIVAERRLTDPQEILDQAGIRQNVKDAATDVCRELVDQERLLLPLDKKLIDQLNAATQQEAQEPYDQYGRVRRIYGRGEFHALDAFRMMALGMDKQPIEAIQAEARGPHGPVLDRFG